MAILIPSLGFARFNYGDGVTVISKTHDLPIHGTNRASSARKMRFSA
jgi:hypothetical protein